MTLNDRCKAAGRNNRELESASLSLSCVSRPFMGSGQAVRRPGSKRTQERFPSTGVVEVACYASLMTLGRETSADVSCHLTTRQYKGNRSLDRSVEESARFVVPLGGTGSIIRSEGRDLTSVNSCNAVEEF